MKVAVVGALEYFAQRSPPRTPEDLASHSCVQNIARLRRTACSNGRSNAAARRDRFRWTAGHGQRPRLGIRAAVDGLGIAYTLEALAEPFLRSGQLVQILGSWSPAFEGLFLYYPGRRRVPAALRAFIDLIRVAGT
jgi:DNA-binding transcriptional LysR family regulator